MADPVDTESASTQALIVALQHELAQLRREANLGMLAKLDNLDRSTQETRLALENLTVTHKTHELTRQQEIQRIYQLLQDERVDHKEVVTAIGKDEGSTLLREMVREEIQTRRNEKHMVEVAARAVWGVGGKYIVAAIAFLIVAAVMKMTGTSISEVLGLMGR